MARSKKSKKKTTFFSGLKLGAVALGAVLLISFKGPEPLKRFAGNLFSRLRAPLSAPSVSKKPKLVFIIDDIGYHLNYEKELRDLGDDVVYAVLPMLPYSKHFGLLSEKTHAEVILHLPLETVDGTVPGRGLITRQMPESQILEVLRTNLDSVPHHLGANNHMGSLGTSDPALMRVILKEFKKQNLLFLDSYTTPNTVIPAVGKELGMQIMKRDVFLDNVDEKPAIREQIRKLKTISKSRGYAIGIGHYRYNTLTELKEQIPRLKAEGFEIISLRQMSRVAKSKKSR
ncbi:MAG TPA: divergent polysaccharide deacetylase family protein [Verrucomicrobiae bacterium]|jgi:polysaccharide deacetylase 2 family uncharacterized protein YibQ|nr:divergent polysaccharide deacetylase family protein [Verrucomicrobiae bacterium]